MFKRTKRTLAALALTTVVGCSQLQPVTPTRVEAVSLHIHSDTASTALLSTLREGYRESHPSISFQTDSASQQRIMQRLLASDVPYVVSSYLPRDDRLWAAPLAQDALALVIHPATDVSQISSSAIRRLYQGFVTNWQQVGGSDTPVTLYSRDTSSAAYKNFARLIMGQQRVSPGAQILPSSAAILNEIATQPGSLGYVPLSHLNASDARVQVLAIDDTVAAIESIQAGTYPLRYTVYIIGLNEPAGAYRAFIGWSQSPDGQAVIAPPYARLPR